MKKNLLILGALMLAIIGSAFISGDPETESLALGTKAPMQDYKMQDFMGKGHNLKTLAKEEGLLVIFSCNTCPFVVGREGKSEGWEGRYNELYKAAVSANIGMVLVNSNEAKRGDADSKSAMAAQAKSKGYQMPYVIDQNHQLADAFGARTTPHVFLFNGAMELVYKGAIDDNVDAARAVQEPWLINAMRSLANDEEITVSSTKPIGCSIKRVK